MDDIIFLGSKKEEYNRRLEKVIEATQRVDLKLQKEKFEIAVPESWSCIATVLFENALCLTVVATRKLLECFKVYFQQNYDATNKVDFQVKICFGPSWI